MKLWIYLKGIALMAVLFFCFQQANAQQTYEFTASKYLLGTKIDITAESTSIDSMKKAIYYSFREIERIQQVMSSTIDSSEIYMINRQAGVRPVKVSYETYAIIQRSIEYSRKYNGVFDITIGCITGLWGFNSDKPVTNVPDKKIIDSLLNYVGYEKIVMNAADTSVYLPLEGMKIDLGGIAKGYAIDRAASVMKSKGMTSFFINGGGDIYVSGLKSGGAKWSIGIKHPRNENEISARLFATDCAIGTSGDYERFAIIDGRRYHHIFDVKTGYSCMKSQSATAIVQTTEEAVVLSKILFIEGGEKYTQNTNGVAGLVIDAEGKLFYDAPLNAKYEFEIIK